MELNPYASFLNGHDPIPALPSPPPRPPTPPPTLPPPPPQPHAIIQPFDQDAWAKRYAAYHLEPALALFQAARNWNLLFLTSVSQDDRRRRTTHPERGTMTFWTIIE